MIRMKRVSLLSTDARIYFPLPGSDSSSVPGLILRTQFMALFTEDILELEEIEAVIRPWLNIKFIQGASICNKCIDGAILPTDIIPDSLIVSCCGDLLKNDSRKRISCHSKCYCGTFVKIECMITENGKLCVSIVKWEDLGTGLEFVDSARLESPDLDACQRFIQGCQHVDDAIVGNQDSEQENVGPVISDGDLFDRSCSLLQDENYKKGSYGMDVVLDNKKIRPPWFDPTDSALDNGMFRAWYMSNEYLDDHFDPK